MSGEPQIPIHIRELRWLAYFYELHGYEDKAREILMQLSKVSGQNVIDIHKDENKKEA